MNKDKTDANTEPASQENTDPYKWIKTIIGYIKDKVSRWNRQEKINMMLVIITGLLLWVSFLQYKQYRRSNDIAEKTLRLLNTPTIYFDYGSTITTISKNKIRISFNIKNATNHQVYVTDIKYKMFFDWHYDTNLIKNGFPEGIEFNSVHSGTYLSNSVPYPTKIEQPIDVVLDSNEANNLSQDINLLFIEVHYKNFAYEESIFQWVCTIFGGRNTNHDWKRVYFRTSPEDYKEK